MPSPFVTKFTGYFSSLTVPLSLCSYLPLVELCRCPKLAHSLGVLWRHLVCDQEEVKLEWTLHHTYCCLPSTEGETWERRLRTLKRHWMPCQRDISPHGSAAVSLQISITSRTDFFKAEGIQSGFFAEALNLLALLIPQTRAWRPQRSITGLEIVTSQEE